MINAIFANKDSFKAVEFTPGFNVILADRAETSRGASQLCENS